MGTIEAVTDWKTEASGLRWRGLTPEEDAARVRAGQAARDEEYRRRRTEHERQALAALHGPKRLPRSERKYWQRALWQHHSGAFNRRGAAATERDLRWALPSHPSIDYHGGPKDGTHGLCSFPPAVLVTPGGAVYHRRRQEVRANRWGYPMWTYHYAYVGQRGAE